MDIGDPGPGVTRAWERLASRNPGEVCLGSGAEMDKESGAYVVRSFGSRFLVDPRTRSVVPHEPHRMIITERLAYFFLHSVVWYLGNAEDFPESGRLIKPEGLRGGANFFTGAHTLPLREIADRYDSGRGLLTGRGLELGGTRSPYGDEAVTLRPLPRVSSTLVLWYGDEEFGPRADILFDSSIEIRLPLDVIWSVAMMTTLVFL